VGNGQATEIKEAWALVALATALDNRTVSKLDDTGATDSGP